MIRYVITLFLLIQTNILPLSIDITIDGHSQNDNIVNILQKYADYEKDIKPYITTHKLVTDEDIINSEKINMKYILKQGYLDEDNCFYVHRNFDDADNLIFYKLTVRLSTLDITEDGIVNDCKGKIKKDDTIHVYALTKKMLDTLKKLKFTNLIIKDCRTNTYKTHIMNIYIFDDNITKDINNNFIIDTIQKKATKKIKKELESMDKDLCYHEFEITKINNENLKYYKQDDILMELAQYSDKEQINITIQIKTHYEITVEYAFGCPPNTALRKHPNGVISHEDNFGFGGYLPIKEVIQFTNKNITVHEIEKLIFSKCQDDSAAAKSKYSFSVFDSHFKFPNEKEYTVGIELPEDSVYLRNVKLNIDIPNKTNQTMHKLSGKYIIHCTGDYDKKEVLKEFENQLRKKRNDKHLTSITDNMIQTITQELDKQSQENYNRLYGLTFDEKSLQKYPDIFKSILNENTQQNTTNTNNPTTPTLNKNKTKKFGNKKPKYCCCCCNKCC